MKSRANLRIAPNNRRAQPQRNPAPVALMSVSPLQLSPIAWGMPDRELGRGVCLQILKTTAATVIPFDPRTDAKLRKELRSLGIRH